MQSNGKKYRISCLGPEGSYSELAATKMCEDAEIVLCHTFPDAVHKLLAHETDYAVLPVENSLNGGVLECLDLLEEENIFAIEEFPLAVDHRLATLTGVRPDEVNRIYSHDQALMQCTDFLNKNYPNATLVRTSATAESLEKLDAHSAGIVGGSRPLQGEHRGPQGEFHAIFARGGARGAAQVEFHGVFLGSLLRWGQAGRPPRAFENFPKIQSQSHAHRIPPREGTVREIPLFH